MKLTVELRDQMAFDCLMSHLKSFYLKNVYHDTHNQFGIGKASSLVKVLVQAVDERIDVWNEIHQLHAATESGVALMDKKLTSELVKQLKGKL